MLSQREGAPDVQHWWLALEKCRDEEFNSKCVAEYIYTMAYHQPYPLGF